jgi:putative transposase
MARLPRLVLAGQPHLVLQRALDGRAPFADEADRARFIDILREGLAVEHVQLHAYALASRELRMLLTPATPQALARLAQALGRRYVVAYNRRHERRGTLWDGRFRACPVEPGDFVLAAMAWIEQDGEAGFASSAAHHLGIRNNPLLSNPPAYWDLGNTPFEREAAWRRHLAAGLAPLQEAQLQRALRGGWALGSPAFAASIASAERPAAPRPAGRPRRPRATP